MRLLILAAVLVPSAAHAGGELDLAIGGGVAGLMVNPCVGPSADCTMPITRDFGAAPLVRAAVRGDAATANDGLRLRYGFEASAMVQAHGSIVSGAGAFGLGTRAAYFDVISGFARVHAQTFDAVTMTLGLELGVHVRKTFTAFARAELDAALDDPRSGAFAGVGIETALRL
jgi:hypothetical protein